MMILGCLIRNCHDVPGLGHPAKSNVFSSRGAAKHASGVGLGSEAFQGMNTKQHVSAGYALAKLAESLADLALGNHPSTTGKQQARVCPTLAETDPSIDQ